MLAHAAREGEHLKIEGPAISPKAKSAEMMSLAIHELATNAVKNGALSNGGRLSSPGGANGAAMPNGSRWTRVWTHKVDSVGG